MPSPSRSGCARQATTPSVLATMGWGGQTIRRSSSGPGLKRATDNGRVGQSARNSLTVAQELGDPHSEAGDTTGPWAMPCMQLGATRKQGGPGTRPWRSARSCRSLVWTRFETASAPCHPSLPSCRAASRCPAVQLLDRHQGPTARVSAPKALAPRLLTKTSNETPWPAAATTHENRRSWRAAGSRCSRSVNLAKDDDRNSRLT